MRVYDVIVVGAGPAGSTLAALLARDGYSALLLERHSFPRDKVCGDLVSSRGLGLLDDLGCYEAIERKGYFPITGSVVYLDEERLAQGELPKLPDHPPHGHAIPRIELDEMIFRQAADAGAESVEGCRVTGFEQSGSLVAVTGQLGKRRQQFFGRMIVGADGAGSVVARCAGLEMRDPRYTQLAIRAYCSGIDFESASLYFAEDFFPGYGWVFPVNDSLANIGVGMVKESAQRYGMKLKEFYGRLTGHLRRVADESGGKIELTPTAGWPIKTYGGARRNFFHRGLLIGDAGCFVDPISGEGIPLALETAHMAAETIREAFAADDFSEDVLSVYERRWRQHYDADLNVSDLIVSIARNRHLVKVWVNWLRTIARTAENDRDYALKTGGVLAGLLPNREGLSPDVMMKSVMHGPAFWADVFDLELSKLPANLAGIGSSLFRWESDLLSATIKDFPWVQAWMTEIGAKQLKVLEGLAARGDSRI